MTKEELKAKVAKQQSIIKDANNQICSDVKEYIESLPYKVGDKVSCSRCNVCWIASIIPERNCARYSGMIEVRINPAKKELSMDSYKNEMNGIYSTSVCEETIDEAPMAYKPTEEIVELIKPTVDVIDVIKPIYNFKAKS